MIPGLDVLGELAKLKDFQRRTVEHVFHRLYDAEDAGSRFLVADEVGLGKTMVARGVIAKAIERLDHVGVERIDVVYVCSNAAIAHQNLKRLKLGTQEPHFATRLTLLPKQIGGLRKNRVNFVSFTPGTTFDLGSRGGIAEERVLLYRMLRDAMPRFDTALRNLLQGQVGTETWAERCHRDDVTFDTKLAEDFVAALRDEGEFASLEETLDAFRRRRDRYDDATAQARYEMIGRLRQRLARVCVHALEPDLVILDEFQRFKTLLSGEDEQAELARQLFAYPDVRLLLLSATPYRMVTLSHEHDENHYADFLETARFLLADDAAVEALSGDLRAFRRALLAEGAKAQREAERARDAVEARLSRVMCRTERVHSTARRDAMLRERTLPAPIAAADVDQALVADGAALRLGAGETVEYWKSAPYLLNVMREYELKRKLEQARKRPPEGLVEHLVNSKKHLLRARQFSRYEPIEPANARLRALAGEVLDSGAYRLLWLPPSMPYVRPTGPYANLGEGARTKTLVFSSWNMVPDAIASLLSYEAERRMLGDQAKQHRYQDLYRQRRALLRFRVSRERGPQGMPVLTLLYPCATLAEHVDPFGMCVDLGGGAPVELEVLRSHVRARVAGAMQIVFERFADESEAEDARWVWAALPLLDRMRVPALAAWIDSDEGFRALSFDEASREDDEAPAEPERSDDGFGRHVDALLDVLQGRVRLGRPPADLLDVLTDLAIASPAICASRAIRRVARLAHPTEPEVLAAATQVAWGFRALFSVPESMVLVQGEAEHEAYWRRVLGYCVDGNLQAVLDEYAHLLVESEGHIAEHGAEVAATIALKMREALAPRTASLVLHELKVDRQAASLQLEDIRIRCRFALRFGNVRDDAGGTVTRADTVRDAFNSPFRPFVLASTSVGQEGLDFHAYCHRLVHWNLPTNPIDLEQREGRVQRHKGHAVRRNLALAFGLADLSLRWDGDADPWKTLFALAVERRLPGATDLEPYWLFEPEHPDAVAVERVLPMLPMSREVERYQRLKQTLAIYRLAFGQPRQEDLLAYLADHGRDPAEVERLRIDLRPRPTPELG